MARLPKVGATKASKDEIEAATSQTSGTPISVSETAAQTLRLHRIWDHELREMTDIARPISLALATMFVGAALGLTPAVFDAARDISEPTKSTAWHAILIIGTFVACIVLGLTIGFFAVRGQIRLLRLQSDIRDKDFTTRQIHL